MAVGPAAEEDPGEAVLRLQAALQKSEVIEERIRIIGQCVAALLPRAQGVKQALASLPAGGAGAETTWVLRDGVWRQQGRALLQLEEQRLRQELRELQQEEERLQELARTTALGEGLLA